VAATAIAAAKANVVTARFMIFSGLGDVNFWCACRDPFAGIRRKSKRRLTVNFAKVAHSRGENHDRTNSHELECLI
jgi:hypothetical protein